MSKPAARIAARPTLGTPLASSSGMVEWLNPLSDFFGVGEPESSLSAGEAVLRAAVTYAAVVLMVRLGAKRAMGRNTAFDLIVAIMLGSVVSRGITGSAPLAPALAAGAALLALHWLAAVAAMRWSGVGWLIKGRSRELVRDGEVREDQMVAGHITERDLREGLRAAGVDSVDGVEEARLERSGDLSVVPRRGGERSSPAGEPRVVEVDVEEGVQTVRVELAEQRD